MVWAGGLSDRLGRRVVGCSLAAVGGQAGSWAKVAAVGGQAGSLTLGGILISLTGGLPGAATVLMAGPVVAIVVFALFFPDTHGRELEDTAGEFPDTAGVAAEIATPI